MTTTFQHTISFQECGEVFQSRFEERSGQSQFISHFTHNIINIGTSWKHKSQNHKTQNTEMIKISLVLYDCFAERNAIAVLQKGALGSVMVKLRVLPILHGKSLKQDKTSEYSTTDDLLPCDFK
jgi:hypothetical protein